MTRLSTSITTLIATLLIALGAIMVVVASGQGDSVVVTASFKGADCSITVDAPEEPGYLGTWIFNPTMNQYTPDYQGQHQGTTISYHVVQSKGPGNPCKYNVSLRNNMLTGPALSNGYITRVEINSYNRLLWNNVPLPESITLGKGQDPDQTAQVKLDIGGLHRNNGTQKDPNYIVDGEYRGTLEFTVINGN